jgi:hypothetical protein
MIVVVVSLGDHQHSHVLHVSLVVPPLSSITIAPSHKQHEVRVVVVGEIIVAFNRPHIDRG